MTDEISTLYIEPGGLNAELFVHLRGDLIANGSYGRVWRATNKKHLVAVKVIVIHGEINAAINTFKSEIKLMRKLNHCKYIISCHGWFVKDVYAGIVMDFADAGTLSNFLHNNPSVQIPRDLLYRILHELCLAIDFLHSLGIDQIAIHGDIKPSNILLTDELHIKLCDFGGATLTTITAARSADTLPANSAHILTILYTAPEVLRNFRCKKSRSSDIWSFGIVISEARFRQLPFSHYHPSVRERALREYQEPHEIPVGPNPQDAPIMNLRKKCLSRTPNNRPTAAYMAKNWTNLLPYNKTEARNQANEVRNRMSCDQYPTQEGQIVDLYTALNIERTGGTRHHSTSGHATPEMRRTGSILQNQQSRYPTNQQHTSQHSTQRQFPQNTGQLNQQPGVYSQHPTTTGNQRAAPDQHPSVSYQQAFPSNQPGPSRRLNYQVSNHVNHQVFGNVPMPNAWKNAAESVVRRVVVPGFTAIQNASGKSKRKFKSINKILTKKHMTKYFFVLVGDQGVGRHWTVNRYVNNFAGDNMNDNHPKRTFVTEDGVPVQLNFEFGLGRTRHADVILLCFALDRIDSFQNLFSKWKPEALKKFGENTPCLLVGMKVDLRQNDIPSIAPSNIGRQVAGEGLAKGYWECSARTNENVDVIFRHATELAQNSN